MSWPWGYKTWVHSQTQNKVQWLAACWRHVSASSQSLLIILSLKKNSSFITSGPCHTHLWKEWTHMQLLVHRVFWWEIILKSPLKCCLLTLPAVYICWHYLTNVCIRTNSASKIFQQTTEVDNVCCDWRFRELIENATCLLLNPLGPKHTINYQNTFEPRHVISNNLTFEQV